MFDPGSGRSPGRGPGNPLQYSCLENPHGQRNMVGYSPWGHKESDTTDQLTLFSLWAEYFLKIYIQQWDLESYFGQTFLYCISCSRLEAQLHQSKKFKKKKKKKERKKADINCPVHNLPTSRAGFKIYLKKAWDSVKQIKKIQLEHWILRILSISDWKKELWIINP